MSERVSIHQLKPGMVIVQVTEQNGPVKIQKAGLVSSDSMVQGLAEMGVLEVEIDPEQTVEIAASVQQRTQTQALLRGQHDTKAKPEDHLSDQFNRSLFLPTVQSIPSAWHNYVRQSAIYTVLIIGGFAIGFAGATHSRWWPALTQQAQTAAVLRHAQQPDTQVEGTESQQERTELVEVPRQARQPGDQALNAEQTKPGTELVEVPVQPQQEEEGTLLNDRKDDKVEVSPELMAKFNAAVASLDKEANDPEPVKHTKVNVHDDIPRVDQLPARLLTRLPTMSFSAHMYASQPQDRWVRVNGKQLSEGDWIDDRVQIVAIESQRVILAIDGEQFSMSALTDW